MRQLHSKMETSTSSFFTKRSDIHNYYTRNITTNPGTRKELIKHFEKSDQNYRILLMIISKT